MYAFATNLGRNHWDVLVWISEEESINDDGQRAIRRETVVAEDSEGIRKAMELGPECEIELN